MEPLELAGIVKTSVKLDPRGNNLLTTQSRPTAKLKDVTKQSTSTDSKANSKSTSSTKSGQNRRKSSL